MPQSSVPTPRRRAVAQALAAAAALLLVAPPPGLADNESAVDERSPESFVQSHLQLMTLEEKVGQLFVVHAYGADAHHVTPAQAAANQAAYGVDTPAEVVEKYHLGGVIYFNWSGNVENPGQVAELTTGCSAPRRPMADRR